MPRKSLCNDGRGIRIELAVTGTAKAYRKQAVV